MLSQILGRKNALIVAHPDDETLWAGGLLLRFPDRDWTVIACSTPQKDPRRAAEFLNACVVLGVQGRVLPVVDSNMWVPLHASQVLEAIQTGLCNFDCVVTHGYAGEYGHMHHQQIHKFVKQSYQGPTLGFGWQHGKQGEHRLELTEAELAAKMVALRCYGDADGLVGKLARLGVPTAYETYHLEVRGLVP